MHLTKETAEQIRQLTSQCLKGLSHFRCMSPSLCDYRNGTATFQGIKTTQGGPGLCSQTGGHVLPDPWLEDTGLTGKTCATPTQACCSHCSSPAIFRRVICDNWRPTTRRSLFSIKNKVWMKKVKLRATKQTHMASLPSDATMLGNSTPVQEARADAFTRIYSFKGTCHPLISAVPRTLPFDNDLQVATGETWAGGVVR